MRAGLHTLKDLNAASPDTLAAIEGLEEADIESIVAVAAQRAEEIKQAFSEQLESESQLFDEEKFDRVPGVEAGSTLTFSDEEDEEDEEVPEAESDHADAEHDDSEETISQDEADTDVDTEEAASGEPQDDVVGEADASDLESAVPSEAAADDSEESDEARRGSATDAAEESSEEQDAGEQDEEPTEPRSGG
jgi:hypothetical protein